MTKWKIYNEDAVAWAKNYTKGKFHALLTDAPYHLTSITKRLGKNGSAPAKFGSDGVFQRSSKGFMGTQWDGGDVAFRPETWAAFGEVLYPGAFGMAFSASRNWHRMAVAIEDAGFIIHPTMFFLWIQGQGFPKATNISKQVDKQPKAELVKFAEALKNKRISLGYSLVDADNLITGGTTMYSFLEGRNLNGELVIYPPNKVYYESIKLAFGMSGWDSIVENNLEVIGNENGNFGFQQSGERWNKEREITKHTSVEAKIWEGHRYGLQALKPSVEPIIVFQKPYEGKPVDNIVGTGAGALNIDAARIPLATDDEYTINTFDDGAKPWGNGAGHKYTSRKIKEDKRLGGNGSWKTDKAAKNVYEGGYEGIDIASSPLGRWPSNLILDEVSAEKLDMQTGETVSRPRTLSNRRTNGSHEYGFGSDVYSPIQDSGGASRFFFQVSTQLDEVDPFLYQGKVSPKERNAGLQELPDKDFGNMMHNSNNTGEVSKGFERFGSSVVKNNHPTLKPINLAKYLATLLLPPVEYAPRRIFIPFSGSGSEMIGAGLAGWEHVVGVEFDTENNYVEIAKKRLEHWIK